MRDKTDAEIKGERERILTKLHEELNDDIKLIDSFFERAPVDAKPLWFLGKSLELLSTADVAVFAKGWQDYRGCKMEHRACLEYSIPIWYDV